MADLPPLETIPREVTDAEFKVAGDRARWAETFGGNDRSLAQRARRNEDITRYGDMLVQRRQSEFQDRIAADKGARDVWYKTQQLQLQQNKFLAAEAAREQSMRYASQLQPMRLQREQAALDLSAARELAALNAENRRIDLEKKAMAHAELLDRAAYELRSSGLIDGTPGFAAGIEAAISQAPLAPKEMITSFRNAAKLDPEWLKKEAEEKPVREEFFNSLEEARAKYPNASIIGGPGTNDAGQAGFIVRGANIPAPRTGAVAELSGSAPAQTKSLDRETASSLLKEAGGDKAKARELARSRGYQF